MFPLCVGPSVFRCFFQSQYGRVLGGVKGGYHHTARGTKPAEVAAGGAVMAVRVPGFSPFTVLLQKKQSYIKTGNYENAGTKEPCGLH